MLDQVSATSICVINNLAPGTTNGAVDVNTTLDSNHTNQYLNPDDEEYLRLMDEFNDEEERFHAQYSHLRNN
ncbi:hypothetical protein PtB15_3B865 [Puccinia triticina]|nr:hypothetical protein PtB15_3B865 [Puccinia triticina]